MRHKNRQKIRGPKLIEYATYVHSQMGAYILQYLEDLRAIYATILFLYTRYVIYQNNLPRLNCELQSVYCTVNRSDQTSSSQLIVESVCALYNGAQFTPSYVTPYMYTYAGSNVWPKLCWDCLTNEHSGVAQITTFHKFRKCYSDSRLVLGNPPAREY